ncbi:hypothetical protein NLJ89_g2524 [Agrocybe chaxingu]|uniref:Cytochrome P450 n=1 Tax=Agrocybe chaxingu TaxID=84603 RepID=A0A9W8K6F7_9AGAR|nr:hypothetical protein NLJ89_g2524 [Agrocybe chaxingu]
MTYQQLVVGFAAASVVYVTFKISRVVWYEWTSPLHALRGPSSDHFLFGHMKQILEAEDMIEQQKWVEEYGPTFKFKGFAGMNRLYTTDPKALNHIFMNNMIYQKPDAVRHNLRTILGNGLVVVEGEKHRQQRKIMNPAFGPAQIREMVGIFIDKGVELRDILLEESKKEQNHGQIDVLYWLSKTTLDVIGLAGFDYKFNALTSEPEHDELHQAFTVIFRSGSRMSIRQIVRGLIPWTRPILKHVLVHEESNKATKTMTRIGNELLKDSRAALSAENGAAEKASWDRKDLLSLLLRANMATDLPAAQRMSDDDVVSQVPTFMVAGHETTSVATTWALFELTQHPEIQSKLRNEVLSVEIDNPTMEELNALPYLDMFVRETLRLHTPVPSTIRVAVQDDILPLSEPVQGANGQMVHEIRIRKGQTMAIPLLAVNCRKALWGNDASEFRPERWEHTPEAASVIPGVWSNLLTFLGGPRACIGYRLSLAEMKALLFTLVKAFDFELAVPPSDLMSVAKRPSLRSEPYSAGNKMPLKLKPVQRG